MAKTKVRRLTTPRKSPEHLPRVPVLDIPGNADPFDRIPELACLTRLDDDALAGLIEIAIAIMDARLGDVDLEQDDHDEDNADQEDTRLEDDEDGHDQEDDRSDYELDGAGWLEPAHWAEKDGPTGLVFIPEHPRASPLFGRPPR